MEPEPLACTEWKKLDCILACVRELPALPHGKSLAALSGNWGETMLQSWFPLYLFILQGQQRLAGGRLLRVTSQLCHQDPPWVLLHGGGLRRETAQASGPTAPCSVASDHQGTLLILSIFPGS